MTKNIEISGETRLVGFFASPARHSISPKMHNVAFKETGIDARYLAFDIKPEDLKVSIQAIRSLGLIGANISMPHKQNVLALLDELSPEAQLIGAVNTIVNNQGKLIGHNTDGLGFMRSLEELELNTCEKEITILGAGGAATAIICQAALDGVQTINIISRKSANFSKMVEKIKEIEKKTACRLNLIEANDQSAITAACQRSCLLINATNVGMGELAGQIPLIKLSDLHADLAVSDIIYHPAATQLLIEARKIGAKTMNGLGMLIHQGAVAFELWTNEPMPIELVKKALLK